jgi:hypothetical protein
MATTIPFAYNPPFSIGTGFNGSVYTFKVDSNKKIVCGGDFNEFNGSSQNLFNKRYIKKIK